MHDSGIGGIISLLFFQRNYDIFVIKHFHVLFWKRDKSLFLVLLIAVPLHLQRAFAHPPGFPPPITQSVNVNFL